MKHPKRAITRDVRTRNPKRPGRVGRELDEAAWPEGAVRVRDVMARPAVTFREGMLVGAAVKAMRSRNIRHAPVLDDKGHLVGIVSDRDLRQAVLGPAIRDAFETENSSSSCELQLACQGAHGSDRLRSRALASIRARSGSVPGASPPQLRRHLPPGRGLDASLESSGRAFART